jgi:DNA mismatch repair protein MutL
MSIARLPQHVVDQIAAGEVVERPASVVKELVENALDAGARSIRIEVDGGGLTRIAVHDDGGGIPAEELALALAAHATSKIRAVDDLLAVRSFGFRGEALASIASISHLTLSSRAREAESGAQIVSRGGVLEAARPLARAAGTSIEVRDLFFNTPARRKFMKAEATETAHVVEAVLRPGLARMDVAFELVANGRASLGFKSGQGLRDRIAAGFGRELATSLVDVRSDHPGAKLRGLLAPPDRARARGNLQHLWINGRFVRDRTVQGAVRAAYRDFLAESLTPVWFLFLDLDPADVDCNVHPTKIEVRLRRSQDVYRVVLSAIERALRAADLTPRFRMAPWRSGPAVAPANAGSFTAPETADGSAPLREREATETTAAATNADSLFDVLSERTAPVAAPRVSAHATGAAAAAPALVPPTAPRLLPGRFVQIAKTYLATATAEGLLIFDQHALHERVLYRHLREQWRSKSIRRQELLHPIRVELPAADVLAVDAASELLDGVGVRAAPLGKTSVAISSLPAIAAPNDVAGLLGRLVELLRGERPEGRADDFADRMLFTMACHRAVRAGDVLTEEQVAALLAESEKIEHAHTCPHGRPTRVLIPVPELENLFKRRGF